LAWVRECIKSASFAGRAWRGYDRARKGKGGARPSLSLPYFGVQMGESGRRNRERVKDNAQTIYMVVLANVRLWAYRGIGQSAQNHADILGTTHKIITPGLLHLVRTGL